MSKDLLILQLKTFSLTLSLLLTASLTGLAGGQDQALKVRYEEALQRAHAREFERAYEMAFKVVRGNEFYYEAQVLRIALAVILKKAGSEEPKHLIRVAKDYAPIGSNLERDVQNLSHLLSGASGGSENDDAVLVRKEVAVSPYVRKRIALVVGIGSFKDPKINPLGFSSNDARAFADTLKQVCKFDDVKVLIDIEATRRNILTELDKIARSVQSDDLVVIYVASHGSPQDLDSAGVNYIVTHDSEVDNLYATSYKMKDLLEDIQTRIPAQRVVAFIDTCFSGATFKQKPSTWVSSNRALKIESSGVAIGSIEVQMRKAGRGIRLAPGASNDGRRQQDIGRVIIASSRQNQKAWESDSIKHGYFTYYLMQALRRDGAISVQGLYDYVSAEVPKAVLHDRNAEQNPTMVSSVDSPLRIYLKY